MIHSLLSCSRRSHRLSPQPPPTQLNNADFFAKCEPFMIHNGMSLARKVAGEYGDRLAKMATENHRDLTNSLRLLEVGCSINESFSFKWMLEDKLEKTIHYTGIDIKRHPDHTDDPRTDKDTVKTPNSSFDRGDLTYKMGSYGDVFDERNNDISNYDVVIARNVEPTIIDRLIKKLMSSARNGAVIVITTASDHEATMLETSLLETSLLNELKRMETYDKAKTKFNFINKDYPNYRPDSTIFVIKIKDKD